MSNKIKEVTLYQTTDGYQFTTGEEAREHQQVLNRPKWVFTCDSKGGCRNNIKDAMLRLQTSFSWTNTPEGKDYWRDHQKVLWRMIKELEE